MRTLKKTLSLVLVVAMVLGLCVVGASAKDKVESFTDDYQKVGAAYQEAVGVLVGIGVIDGMTETALEPQGNYTREQAAKIIAYMLLGKSKADSLKCTVAPFDDVAASRWSAGYIAFCVEQGIIDGMTATTYEPTGTLTGFQWAKMLLCAIGFGVKGEFTGSSWSVNTALVAHKVNLFAGDLDGADHTALRREQAALYAFNALNTAKVAYSPNVTSYVYGIQGYETVNGIGSTLAKDVYDLKYAQGIIVDAEGMGAGYTVVSKDYSTANVTNKIKADNDIDMMYHAARVWYTGTNTGVYTYDLAKTTTYKCQEMDLGAKDATAAKAKTGLTIGTGTAYEAYLVDNSAIGAGSAYVTLKAEFGYMGYVDAAKKTTSAGTHTVASANVRTDVSNIKYGAPVIIVYTSSNTESANGMYIYPVTSTVGTIKSITKESGAITSVTLTDGTVLKVSKIRLADDVENFVIGNVYTFALDSHGHIVYATRDYARTLWAYTGEYKYTNEFGAISSDWVMAYRFINVTTGEEAFYPVNFVNNGGAVAAPSAGQYYDISVTAGSDGKYVAERVTANDNTYAAGYIVANATFEINSSSQYVANILGNNVYFNGETVTFLVATGTGANMKVNSYTGIAALKEAFGVAANGSVTFSRAAFTVSATQTGHWNASVVFVMADNVSTTSQFVFVPNDIDESDWTEIEGAPNYYQIYYGNGAYLEGKPYTVVFDNNMLVNHKLVRGFYSISTTYDQNGNPTVQLNQRMDNVDGCYYQNVTFTATGVNGTWLFNGQFKAVEGTTAVYDLTGRNISTLEGLWQYFNSNKNLEFAFTVNPYTGIVDYVYVTAAGWDAKYTISLSDELAAAGWVFADNGKTTMELTDTAAWTASGKNYTVDIYNAKFKDVTLDYEFTADIVADNSSATTSSDALEKGVMEVTFHLDGFTSTVKDHSYVIGGVDNDRAIGFKVADDMAQYFAIKDVAVANNGSLAAGEYTFGTPVQVTVRLKAASNGNVLVLTFRNDNSVNGVQDIVVKTPTQVSAGTYYDYTFTVYPMANDNYTLVAYDWE